MAENNEGYIVVQVSTANEAIPLANANVMVTEETEKGESLIRLLKTDRSGKTEVIAVPAPPAANSRSFEGVNRFSKYNIRVDYPGYYTVENVNVPVFSGQKSIQSVSMIPLGENEERGKVITVTEEEPFENE